MKAQLVTATRARPNTTNGLLTFLIEIPYFIWVELLTHKRLSRNSSSARAQSLVRHTADYYTPVVFRRQGNFMSSSVTPADNQETLTRIWQDTWVYGVNQSQKMADAGVAKEQYNRLVPAFKMVRGVVTGTEGAWKQFLKLRLSLEADSAMQEFAGLIDVGIRQVEWRYSYVHLPFGEPNPPPFPEFMDHYIKVAAIIARTSTARPKSSGEDSDLELGKKLLSSKHLSPFEHIAFWTESPILSAIACKPSFNWGSNPVFGEDDDDVTPDLYGWTSMRAYIEDKDEQ